MQTVLTAAGFKRKRYEDFLPEMEQAAREAWGENVNLDAKGPLGKFIRNQAMARAEDHELAEAIYYSDYVHTAVDIQLDYAIARASGIKRIQPKKATGEVVFSVTPGKEVTGGVIVATAQGVLFMTTATVTDTGNTGSVTAPVEAMEAGPAGNTPPNTITVVKTALAGVNGVTNAAATIGGRVKETDNEFRDRHYSSLSRGGAGTIDAIRAKLLETPGVREAFVTENNLDVADGAGRPPHSFEATVLGGEPVDVATAILRSKAAGIRAFGTQTQVVQDSSGNNQTIGFSLAAAIAVYVHVDIVKNASFPQNGENLIKYEVINYIGGTDELGQTFSGLGLGDDVKHAKIVSAILSKIPGIEDITVTLRKGTAGGYAAANVVIESTEVAETAAERVGVTIG